MDDGKIMKTSIIIEEIFKIIPFFQRTAGIPSGNLPGIRRSAGVQFHKMGFSALPLLQPVSEATISGDAANAKPFVPSPAAYDTCLSATLGYTDQSYVPGNTFALGHLIKIWLVTAVNSNYPAVFVRDDNGQGRGQKVFLP
jgi:hypothetical protein